MANNSSFTDGSTSRRRIDERVILVQVLVVVFLSINIIMIVTFSMKDVFYTTMRYILFAHALMSDCVTLFTTNLMLILSFTGNPVHMLSCLIMFILTTVCIFLTPLTLTAMTLERYVAICMPLRHAELCSTRSTLQVFLIIYGLGVIPCFLIVLVFFVSVPTNYKSYIRFCAAEIFIVHEWPSHMRSAVSQFYFLVMFVIIAFSYIHVSKVAKAASGENRKSSRKGLRTVLLHGFQLLLCLIQLLCPMVEAAILQSNIMLYENVRYFNYIMFIIAPRCMSPLIYGVRDEKFFLALKYNLLCGLLKNKL
ncbi:odorant receptor 131-2-like [Salarias fasciatus]|uniref:Odorant receptor 131-2-like n=1 Tax=Salarias fasciatus TaxID=181472 RepID=A0A672H2W4_SALFA|nr:odorant receptor 131-2-like [Salarias fasciatus]